MIYLLLEPSLPVGDAGLHTFFQDTCREEKVNTWNNILKRLICSKWGVGRRRGPSNTVNHVLANLEFGS